MLQYSSTHSPKSRTPALRVVPRSSPATFPTAVPMKAQDWFVLGPPKPPDHLGTNHSQIRVLTGQALVMSSMEMGGVVRPGSSSPET